MPTVPTALPHELDARLEAVVEDLEEVRARTTADAARRRLISGARCERLAALHPAGGVA